MKKFQPRVTAIAFALATLTGVSAPTFAQDEVMEEVVTIGDESINRRITGKVDFRVQIGAFKEQIPEHLARQYLIFRFFLEV